jgi:Polyketide cyclase / dehydrase and lipid transport
MGDARFVSRGVHRGDASASERRYQVVERVEVAAPVEKVYEVASDPSLVPVYAPEIVRIEHLENVGEGVELVRSHIKVGPFTFAHPYRYLYRPPTSYAGVQEGGRLYRGYFSLSFRALGAAKTAVTHVEGIRSRVPGLARVLGVLYFRVLARGGARDELEKLKQLVESRIKESREVINEI